VNVDELLVSQPDTGEDALQITETLIRSGGVDCVVVDSVAALVPKAEIEGEIGDSFVGIQARLMSQALRKLTGAVAKPVNQQADPQADCVRGVTIPKQTPYKMWRDGQGGYLRPLMETEFAEPYTGGYDQVPLLR